MGMEEELTEWLQGWWRVHPEATLSEMETVLDQRMAELRVRVLAGALVREEASSGVGSKATELCPVCGTALVRSGRRKRKLKTRGEQELVLEREYMCCPRCGAGIFPPGP